MKCPTCNQTLIMAESPGSRMIIVRSAAVFGWIRENWMRSLKGIQCMTRDLEGIVIAIKNMILTEVIHSLKTICIRSTKKERFFRRAF